MVKKFVPRVFAQATITMRGFKKVERSLEPLTPSGSITLADPLQFQWREPAADLTYRIQLIDSQNKVLVSKDVTGNTFTLHRKSHWSAATTMCGT